MSVCERYIRFSQNALTKGVGCLSQTSHSLSKRTQQHCYGCLSRQHAVPWKHTVRTFFSFFRTGQNEPKDADAERPLPTYPIIHELGKVSPSRTVPAHIAKPEWADTGVVDKKPLHPQPVDIADQEDMRIVSKLARKILDLAAAELRIGVTTDYIDEFVHNLCIKHNVYPSPLNYYGFPKSVCTSVNNVIQHGIPDDRPLHDGDIINLDISIYQNGLHSVLSETYLVGNVDAAGKHLVKVARRCRDEAIKKCQPYEYISVIGNTITEICEAEGLHLCPNFDGHGIGRYFHCKPHIWHYSNRYPEIMEPGMAFTIEPVIMERPDVVCRADDDWTMFAQNHTRSANFEHTLLITNSGCEVLTAGKNEDFGEAKPQDQDDDDIIKSHTSTSSNWTFK